MKHPTIINVVAASVGLLLLVPAMSHAQQAVSGSDLVKAQCAACHSTPGKTDLLGNSLGTAYAPELSGNAYVGLGTWSIMDIVDFLKNGGNRHSVASGMMAGIVTETTQAMSDQQLTAIATYLKSLPGSGKTKPAPIAASNPAMTRGKQVFDTNCTACHTSKGTGVPAMVSALDTPAIRAPQATNLIRTVLQGGTGAVTQADPTGAGMPSFDWKLGDSDIAAVLTYIRNAFGNAAAAVQPADVASMRKDLGAKAALTMDH